MYNNSIHYTKRRIRAKGEKAVYPFSFEYSNAVISRSRFNYPEQSAWYFNILNYTIIDTNE